MTTKEIELMTGASTSDKARKKARQERVMELIDQGFRLKTIAQMLEVNLRTIERDWKEMREVLIADLKNDAQGYASRIMAEAEQEMEILSYQLKRAREEHDDVRARRIMDQRHKQRMEIAKLRQSFGWAPKEAEKIDVNTHVENPLADMIEDGLGTEKKAARKSR